MDRSAGKINSLPSSNLHEVIRLLLRGIEVSPNPIRNPDSLEELKANLRRRMAELEAKAKPHAHKKAARLCPSPETVAQRPASRRQS